MMYASQCGPGAFAAVTGCRRGDAAKTLTYWKQRAGWAPSPDVTPMVLAVALVSRRYPLERWHVKPGALIAETADDFSQRVWRTVRRERELWGNVERAVADLHDFRAAVDPAIKPIIKLMGRCGARRAEARELTPYTIAGWLARRRVGTWLLHVRGHVLAARDGTVIAGDTPWAQQYGPEPLQDAWRVLPRNV